MQSFGSVWTLQKLNIIEKYLNFYTKALYGKFKICYIDAFAGSGYVNLKKGNDNSQLFLSDLYEKDESLIDGSAIRSLKYPFNKFTFFEKKKIFYIQLKERIDNEFYQLKNKISIHNTDCNDKLMKINTYDWYGNKYRGVVFLDPYAMHLSWECLKEISKTKAFDVWYLFPLHALSRNLNNDGNIAEENKKTITKCLGTNEWENVIYKRGTTFNLFQEEETEMEKQLNIEGLKKYICDRLKDTFYTVSSNPVLLRNSNNAPMFLLCFMGSNPDPKASGLSLKAANHILSHTNL